MSLLANIPEFSTGSYLVRRSATGAVVDGVYTPGAQTEPGTYTMVIQPANMLQQRTVPEALHAEGSVVAYIATELLAVSPAGRGDRIVIGADEYEVYGVDGPHTLDGGTHWRAYAARRRP